MTQSMAFSPYKKPFEERLARWEAQLSLVSEVIDEWLALQRAWMYLEPIFSSPDILQQLPQEGKKYSSVDRIWRKVSRGKISKHMHQHWHTTRGACPDALSVAFGVCSGGPASVFEDL